MKKGTHTKKKMDLVRSKFTRLSFIEIIFDLDVYTCIYAASHCFIHQSKNKRNASFCPVFFQREPF